MNYEYCTLEAHIGLKAMNIPNVRKTTIAACLEAIAEGRRFTYTDLFLGVLPRDDEH